VVDIEEDPYKQLWCFAWVCIRSGWEAPANVLLRWMEQIEIPRPVEQRIQYSFDEIADELYETFKSSLVPVPKSFIVSLKRGSKKFWPSN